MYFYSIQRQMQTIKNAENLGLGWEGLLIRDFLGSSICGKEFRLAEDEHQLKSD